LPLESSAAGAGLGKFGRQVQASGAATDILAVRAICCSGWARQVHASLSKRCGDESPADRTIFGRVWARQVYASLSKSMQVVRRRDILAAKALCCKVGLGKPRQVVWRQEVLAARIICDGKSWPLMISATEAGLGKAGQVYASDPATRNPNLGLSAAEAGLRKCRQVMRRREILAFRVGCCTR